VEDIIYAKFEIEFRPAEGSGQVKLTIENEPGQWCLVFLSAEGMRVMVRDLVEKAYAVMDSASPRRERKRGD